MAKYSGAAGCGHSYEINLFGKTSERDRRLAWMNSASGMCNSCYAASKRVDEVKAVSAAVETLANQIKAQYGGLPPADVVANARRLSTTAPHAGTDKARTMLAALDVLGV